MSRFFVGAVRRPLAVISLVIALSAFFAAGLWRGVRLDVSPLGFVEREGRPVTDYENARKNFGADDFLVVAVVCDDVFAAGNLSRLRKLHDRIAKTNGVAEVLSLANAPYARSVDGVVSAERLIPVELESASPPRPRRRHFARKARWPGSRLQPLHSFSRSGRAAFSAARGSPRRRRRRKPRRRRGNHPRRNSCARSRNRSRAALHARRIRAERRRAERPATTPRRRMRSTQ